MGSGEILGAAGSFRVWQGASRGHVEVQGSMGRDRGQRSGIRDRGEV